MVLATHSVQIAWGDVPNWLAVLVGLLAVLVAAATLVAAIVAGRYARQAAHWTKEQAYATNRQVAIEQAALEDSRRATVDARAEAERSGRRLEETRYDAQMPSIYGRVVPRMRNGAAVRWRFVEPGGQPISDTRWLNEGEHLPMRQDITMHFEIRFAIMLTNVSDRPARVRYAGSTVDNGDWQKTEPIYLAPHAEVSEPWSAGWIYPNNKNFDHEWVADDIVFAFAFIVHDPGLNACDRYEIRGSYRNFFFINEEGILHAQGFAPDEWPEFIATPIAPRLYHRIDDDLVDEGQCGGPSLGSQDLWRPTL